ncbi:hypothetical protein C2845_PM04G01900 [Panicum miliaceum]|uniref:Uncharacterized protein n=1 Tax=Panicum miliaceum TaxID=4540 RepID=A0A3L6QSW3_PANMI|nr:hypothetical protein C2845_PM04G01900 [Panicum miliaceum]
MERLNNQTSPDDRNSTDALRSSIIDFDYAEGGGAKNGIGTPGMEGIGGRVTLGTEGIGGKVTLGTEGIGGSVTFGTAGTAGMGGIAAFGMVGTAGIGGRVAAGTVGTAGMGGKVAAGTVGTGGFGTAAGAAAGVVSSARRRAAWLVLLSMSAMTSAVAKRPEAEAMGERT